MAGASRDHVHMVWANSSEGSSSQSETPQIFQQMRFLPGTDSRNGLSQSASFSPYISMLAQNSSSSSSTSQEVTRLQQQQQQQQFLHDFHVNFPASSGPAPPGGPRQVPKGPPGALNAAYAAMETEAKRTNPPSMEGGQWQSLPKQQPCPPQLKFASASSSGQAAPVAAEGRVKEGHPSKGSVGHDKGNCRPWKLPAVPLLSFTDWLCQRRSVQLLPPETPEEVQSSNSQAVSSAVPGVGPTCLRYPRM